MNNFREVNEYILKEWLEFREETAFCEMSPQDKKIAYVLKKSQRKYLRMYLITIRNMSRNN